MIPTRKFDTSDAHYRREALPAMAQVSAPTRQMASVTIGREDKSGGKSTGDHAAISMNS